MAATPRWSAGVGDWSRLPEEPSLAPLRGVMAAGNTCLIRGGPVSVFPHVYLPVATIVALFGGWRWRSTPRQ